MQSSTYRTNNINKFGYSILFYISSALNLRFGPNYHAINLTIPMPQKCSLGLHQVKYLINSILREILILDLDYFLL